MALEGAVVKRSGSCAASPHPTTLAMGVNPYCFSAASETRTSAAAPSERGEEFGAVTVPFALNAAFTVGILSGKN